MGRPNYSQNKRRKEIAKKKKKEEEKDTDPGDIENFQSWLRKLKGD